MALSGPIVNRREQVLTGETDKGSMCTSAQTDRRARVEMTEQDVFNLVSDALAVPREQIHRGSSAQDISGWDSMGTLGILTALSRCSVRVEPADVD